ncbi:MAG: precorrin-2 C(20)-methyltransferase [Candidatus Scalindua sp. AMX11]|nr:MAG: precorrin-2 C(20)-methyltransferase [Candidatus Scalindua sp.]NOG84473.1 precorrin-2 C(20)-methyltransferase [Planctomycetota bacterium]RZV80516.1 MAG: precorrin-2 C(20)-methyltransferase [Candidatus Scalindua sp. SCAELEC01]TDE65267.1 MAG: precorrin-2 C(20)-methyltransferase [Candidatus Scalindua sp. AMX11]GJQ58474.1 MAG: precorrin-2 C(20)-methyltransferase [Candidatus Scalindua sp.]
MKRGTLYGVGLGPGAADLMTLRALDCLRKVDCIILPRKDEKSSSVSWNIAEESVGLIPGQERLFLSFPMSRDPKVTTRAWNVAVKEIRDRIFAGKSVAFISVGDPFIYSSFIYLYEHAQKSWPEIEIKVIPGVSSISAAPIAAGVPVADGRERIAIIPAVYNKDDLRTIIRMFDTIILMKASSVMPEIVEVIESEGLMDKSIYVASATMDKEQIVTDIRTIKGKRGMYFSMVVIAKKDHSGVLFGNGV